MMKKLVNNKVKVFEVINATIAGITASLLFVSILLIVSEMGLLWTVTVFFMTCMVGLLAGVLYAYWANEYYERVKETNDE